MSHRCYSFLLLQRLLLTRASLLCKLRNFHACTKYLAPAMCTRTDKLNSFPPLQQQIQQPSTSCIPGMAVHFGSGITPFMECRHVTNGRAWQR